MAGLKVFVSSTCYDLSILRSDLRAFIVSLGYDPIMSDYADVVYDPRQHTHTSCVEEVSNCDMLVLVIGSRYGGKGIPEALNKVDISSMDELLKNVKDNKLQLSITQLEVIEAIKKNIPVYTFIDKKVYYEHELYEKNRDAADKIVFPAIDKQETAKYIFEFINFLRLKSVGNSIFQFEKMQDIEEVLKKQWSGYFQRLLNEQRHRTEERKRVDILSEQFEDLKTALLSSIANGDQRKVAKGIVNYRRLLELAISLKISKNKLKTCKGDFNELLKENKIEHIIDARLIRKGERGYPGIFFIKNDDTFYDCRMSYELLTDIEYDWNSYKTEGSEIKELLYETISEMYSPRMSFCRYINEPFGQFRNQLMYNSEKLDNEILWDAKE